MAYVKNRDSGILITRYVNFKKNQDVNLTVKTALDGTEYMTRFGQPVCTYELELFVNETGKELLMQAADTLAQIEVSVRIGTFAGRIKDLSNFEQQYYGWYKTTALLSADNEVNER